MGILGGVFSVELVNKLKPAVPKRYLGHFFKIVHESKFKFNLAAGGIILC